MNKIHMKKYFVDWSEGKLDNRQMAHIEKHLKGCSECRTYFDKMQMFLAEPESLSLPELEPDYFLATRIKEIGQRSEHKPLPFRLWKKRIQVVLGTATIILALVIGVFLGKGLSDTQNLSETELVLSYSSMFTDEGIGEVWDNVITQRNGEEQ